MYLLTKKDYFILPRTFILNVFICKTFTSGFIMKKTLLLIPILGFSLTACSKPTNEASLDIQSTQQTQVAQAHQTAKPTVDSEHNAQTSLDWSGQYQGVLPCADCSGIKTELTLHQDKTYELAEQYIDKAQASAIQGSFSFDESGTLITLDHNANGRKFFVGENFIESRNIQTGEKIEGPNTAHYKLSKELH